MPASRATSQEQTVLKPAAGAAYGTRAVATSILANVALVVAKVGAGVLGHSYALIADGVESLSDVASSLIVYGGLRVAALPADDNHPYGHGKAEPLAALGVAVALGAAALVIAVQSVREIRTPHELPAAFTLAVVAGVMILKGVLSHYTGRVASTINSAAVRTDSAHHFSDALTSGLAFVGISIGLWFRVPQADDWAALIAVPIIIWTAVRQAQGPLAELLDTAPPFIDEDVKRIAARVPGVRGLDKCFVRKVGFSYYVDPHVIVDGTMSVRVGHELAHEVQSTVRRELPQVAAVLVHIEPDH